MGCYHIHYVAIASITSVCGRIITAYFAFMAENFTQVFLMMVYNKNEL